MKVIGITGGIGSGKTTVAKMFKALGVPLYIADVKAKDLMNSSEPMRQELIALFGNEAYSGNLINRAFLATKIFENADLLKQMNAIVHPRVGADFLAWKLKQQAPYILKEAAVIFENDMVSQYDFIITVIADLDTRIERVMQRDDTTKDKILAIVNNQWSDEEKVNKSDFVITNHDLDQTKEQVHIIHQYLLKNCDKN